VPFEENSPGSPALFSLLLNSLNIRPLRSFVFWRAGSSPFFLDFDIPLRLPVCFFANSSYFSRAALSFSFFALPFFARVSEPLSCVTRNPFLFLDFFFPRFCKAPLEEDGQSLVLHLSPLPRFPLCECILLARIPIFRAFCDASVRRLFEHFSSVDCVWLAPFWGLISLCFQFTSPACCPPFFSPSISFFALVLSHGSWSSFSPPDHALEGSLHGPGSSL